MRIEVLGPLRVSSRRELDITRRSHRRLLLILALDANRHVSTATLIDRFWRGEPPSTSRASLHMHVTALRRILPADAVVTENGGYRLDLQRHQFDVDDLVASAEAGRRAAVSRDWDAVLEAVQVDERLWRGDPFPDLADDEFADAERRRLEQIHTSLLELKVDALVELDRSADALADLERLVAAHPLRERPWEQLMRARYRLGRHAEALEAYREAWAAFAEIGLEPSAALRRLEKEVLTLDASLAASVPNNLPVELTAFVGREPELEEVLGFLDEHCVLTLVGVGGGGKTPPSQRA